MGGSYNYERYTGLQRSRSANPGVQENDPNRDWTADSKERVHYFSFYVKSPRIGGNTEVRFAYEYATPAGTTSTRSDPHCRRRPVTRNVQQAAGSPARRAASGDRRVVATLSYVYEPSEIYDFAFDPSVINSIVQPSSLVLGYTYRPYTTHSTVFGILYRW